MAAVTTGVNLHTTGMVITAVEDSASSESSAPIHNHVRQELFIAEETTQKMVEIPVTEITEAMRLASQVQVQQGTGEHSGDVLASSSTSTSSGRIDDITAALDSIIKQLSPLESWLRRWKTSRRRPKRLRSLPSG